jgi:arylsulfatase A-like enzyme
MCGRPMVLMFLFVVGFWIGHDVCAETALPNVLWIMTDEQRVDSMGCYGSPWAKTPTLDRLAREGALFVNAVTPSPVCTPARVALMTGRSPAHLGVWSNRVGPPSQPWLTKRFEEAGYRTATFGKIHLPMGARPWQTVGGRMWPEALTWDRYHPPHDEAEYDVVKLNSKLILGGRFPADPKETAEAVSLAEAKTWLESGDTAKPYFLRLSFNLPHAPVVVPEPFDRRIDEDAIRFSEDTAGLPDAAPGWIADRLYRTRRADQLSPSDLKKARRYYYGAVAYVDSLIGDLLAWLEPRGLLEHTIVVFTSDHGVHLGDYGLVQKQTFFEPAVRVPFLFWYAGVVKAGKSYSLPVGTSALLPTVLGLAGLEVPAGSVSLAGPLTAGHEPTARPLFSTLTLSSLRSISPEYHAMVRDGDWKLTLTFEFNDEHGFRLHGDGDGYLVNLREDPSERNNLYGTEDAAKVREHLTAALAGHLKQALPE